MVSRAAPRSAASISRKASIRRSVVAGIAAAASGGFCGEPAAASFREAVIRQHLLDRLHGHRKIAEGQINQAADDRQHNDERNHDPQLPATHGPDPTPREPPDPAHYRLADFQVAPIDEPAARYASTLSGRHVK